MMDGMVFVHPGMLGTYMRHGRFMGGFEYTKDGQWKMSPHKDHACLQGLTGQVFATEEAMHAAVDACFGPEQVALMQQQTAAREAKRRAFAAEEHARAQARTYTGEHYRETRPLKETARRIQAALRQAMATGALPRDAYKVTVREKRQWGSAVMIVWTWYGGERAIEDRIRAMTTPYNKVVGDTDHDTEYFTLRFEWPRAMPKAVERELWQRRAEGVLSPETFHRQVDATYDRKREQATGIPANQWEAHIKALQA